MSIVPFPPLTFHSKRWIKVARVVWKTCNAREVLGYPLLPLPNGNRWKCCPLAHTQLVLLVTNKPIWLELQWVLPMVGVFANNPHINLQSYLWWKNKVSLQTSLERNFSNLSCISFLSVNFENLTIEFHVSFVLNMHIKFRSNQILFTMWSMNLFCIHNFKL